MKYKLLPLFFLCVSVGSFAQKFNHPGTLHSTADLSRMKQKVTEQAEPWYSNWIQLQNSPHAQLSWNSRPSASVCRACPAGTSDNYIPMARDIAAAYGCALRWHITGDSAYANKAISILNVWGSTLTSVYGGTDSQLSRGAYGYEFAVTGDLMYHYGKWNQADKKMFKNMLLSVFLNPCRDFLNGHYGTQDSHYRCNWDGFAMSAVMAIGIFSDSTEIVDYAINYYKNGVGNGNIHHAANFIHDGDLAQWEESGRDQPHTTFGAGLIGIVCQMAWNQGVDLFAYGDNRLLKAVEYIAKYNSFNYVPYKSHTFWYRQKVSWPVYTNTEHYVSGYQRGFFAPVYELAYNHYVNIKGLEAPYLTQMASRTRPEKGGGYNGPNSGGYDILGYGTLAFTLVAGKTAQTIAFNPQTTYKTCALYDLGASSTSRKTVRYSSSDPYIGEIIDNKLYARRPGTITVTAWCDGNATFSNATSVTKTITITDEELIFSGKYMIASNGGKLIECAGTNTDTSVYLFYDRYEYNNVRIDQYWNINPKPQHWYIYKIHGNNFKVINVATGYALSLANKDTASNTKLIMRKYSGTPDQVWTIERIGTRFMLKNKASGKVLSSLANSENDNTAMEIRDTEGIAEQTFRIEEQTSLMPVPGSPTAWHDQQIVFDSIPFKKVGSPDFKPNAYSNSGLKLGFSSSDTQVVKIVGDTLLRIKSVGTVTIAAFQNGNDTTNAALPVYQLLKIVDCAGNCLETGTTNYQLETTNYEVYPNPSKASFHVNVSKAVDMQVTDINGKLCEELKNVSNAEFGENLKAGIYFLKIENKVFKLVKE